MGNGVRILPDLRGERPKVTVIYLICDLCDPRLCARNLRSGYLFNIREKIAILERLNGIMESVRKLSCKRSIVAIAKEHGQ